MNFNCELNPSRDTKFLRILFGPKIESNDFSNPFKVVSDKIKVIEDPTKIGNRSDTDDESDTVDTNLIKSAFAQKIHFRLRNEPLPVAADPPVNNSETNALSELTEEMTEVGQITEEEAEITDDNHEAPEEVAEIPAEETVATEEVSPEDVTVTEEAAAVEAPSEDNPSAEAQTAEDKSTEAQPTEAESAEAEEPEEKPSTTEDNKQEEEVSASIEVIEEVPTEGNILNV